MPPAYEILLLNTAVPQIQAAQSGDTYVVPRDIAFSAALTLSAGTANGVPYLNGSKVLTTGSALTFDGTNLGLGTASPSGASGTTFAVNGGAGQSRLALKNTNSGDASSDGFQIALLSDGVNVVYQNRESGYQSWELAGTEQMRLDSTGLGLGTSSPNAKLAFGNDSDIAFNTGLGSTGTYGEIKAFNTLAPGDPATNIRFIRDVAFFGNDGAICFDTVNTERARITSGGDFQTSSGGSVQVGGTAARATTAGTNRIDIFDGTAPVGTLANGVSFYSASGEANVMDAAGNATLLSPHDSETNEWIFRSKHTPTGKVLKIDVERLLKFVNDHFGLDAVHEFIEE
jgi:hypothetical protein